MPSIGGADRTEVVELLPAANPASGPRAGGRIGLIIALPAEARSVGARGLRVGGCVPWRGGWVTLSGIGPARAEAAAERLIACGIDRIENWGVAGALDANLVPGDIVVPECVRDAPAATAYPTDAAGAERLLAALPANLHVHRGTLWSAAAPVATMAAKQALAARTGAIAVDMEAASIAAVAARAGLPLVVVKAICDPLARELPAGLITAMDGAATGVSTRVVAAIVLGGPVAWRAARALSRDFTHARSSLALAARATARSVAHAA